MGEGSSGANEARGQQRSGGRGGLQSLGVILAALGETRGREMSPISLISPNRHMQGPCRSHRGIGESRPGRSPDPTSSSSLFNRGERGSPKDEISLDSLTPDSCQLALTPDPFWKVTGPEKCKGCGCGRGRRWGQGGKHNGQMPQWTANSTQLIWGWGKALVLLAS